MEGYRFSAFPALLKADKLSTGLLSHSQCHAAYAATCDVAIVPLCEQAPTGVNMLHPALLVTPTNGDFGGKMESVFNREKVNTGRQYNLDLLKTLAIVAMIICHTVTILSGARTDYESEFGYWFADVFLGSYLAVAHAFMFCMGVGFVYSRNKEPKVLLVRGIKIYIM